jgi:hypothetical protein
MKLVLVSALALGINAQFASRPNKNSDSILPQNLLDAQQQFREAQEKLKGAQEEEAPKGRSLANLVASLQDQAATEQNQLAEEAENWDYGNYEDGAETAVDGLDEDAMRRRKKKKKPKRKPAKKPAKKPVKKPSLGAGLFDYGDSSTASNAKPGSKPASTTPKNKAKAPANEKASEFDDKGQWIGGGQFTDYDYYNSENTFNAIDKDNKLEVWDSDPTGNENNNWGEQSYANADLGVDYGFQVNPDMPSFDKKNKNNKENRGNAPVAAGSSISSGTSSRATWDAWGECTAEKIAQNADLLSDEFTVLKLHNYGCWCTIIGEKRECLKGKPQDPIDTFCRDWLACRRCTLFAPHYCGREDLHNKDENAYGLEFFQKIIGATFTCDHLSGDDCAYNRCLCDKEMGEQIMCKMDTFTDIHVGVDVDDCPRHDDADYCAPDSCCGEFPYVTPWSTTCHTCEDGTRSRL